MITQSDASFPNPFPLLSLQHPTVRGISGFDPESACKDLRKSMKGWGTDEALLMQTVIHHSNAQRQELKQKYTTMYGKVSV